MSASHSLSKSAARQLEQLPEGERVLWHGAPDWKALAMHVFHVRAVAIYFLALAGWNAFAAFSEGFGLAGAASGVATAAAAGAFVLLLLSGFAVLIARSTTYVVTSGRVVIMAGLALPKVINVPFPTIGSAALNLRASGNGDIPLEIIGEHQPAYLSLWPHARPWRLNKAQPMLRGVPDAAQAAEHLAAALAEKAGQPAKPVRRQAASQTRVGPVQTAPATAST